MIGWKLKALIGVSLAAVAIAALWHIDSLKTDLEDAEASYKDVKGKLEASESARWKEHASALRSYNLAQSVQEKLDAAESRYDAAIAESMRNGAGLYVAAECPRDTVPETSPAPGQPDAARARIDRATEIDIRRLERDTKRAEVMIDGLQQYIRTECQTKNTPD